MLELMARKKPITANDVADWFINRVNRQEGEIITTDEVLLVVYFAQAWHLANTGRVLFKDGIEAWALGPTVVPSTIPTCRAAKHVGQRPSSECREPASTRTTTTRSSG
jgi:uncharacterized phage-associated protein